MFQQRDRTDSLHVQELRSNWVAGRQTMCDRAIDLIFLRTDFFPKANSVRSLTEAVQILATTVATSYKK